MSYQTGRIAGFFFIKKYDVLIQALIEFFCLLFEPPTNYTI